MSDPKKWSWPEPAELHSGSEKRRLELEAEEKSLVDQCVEIWLTKIFNALKSVANGESDRHTYRSSPPGQFSAVIALKSRIIVIKNIEEIYLGHLSSFDIVSEDVPGFNTPFIRIDWNRE